MGVYEPDRFGRFSKFDLRKRVAKARSSLSYTTAAERARSKVLDEASYESQKAVRDQYRADEQQERAEALAGTIKDADRARAKAMESLEESKAIATVADLDAKATKQIRQQVEGERSAKKKQESAARRRQRREAQLEQIAAIEEMAQNLVRSPMKRLQSMFGAGEDRTDLSDFGYRLRYYIREEDKEYDDALEEVIQGYERLGVDEATREFFDRLRQDAAAAGEDPDRFDIDAAYDAV